MTGMQSFNFQRLSVMMLGMAASTAMAAEISMKGEAKLSGEITEMKDDGTITLVSPVSEKAIMLNVDQVERVTFGNNGYDPEMPEQRIELSNGDILPVKITSMDAGLINAESPYFGMIAIPSDVVSSLQLGIVQKKVVYPGAKGMEGWLHDVSDEQAWGYEDGRFYVTGRGSLSCDVGLPKKFILKFTFGWQSHPGFRLRFAETREGRGTGGRRYVADFSGPGFGIFRESNGRAPVIQLAQSPEQIAKRSMEVEIRMDRTTGLLEVYIDGELEGRYTDTITPIPEGTWISIVSNASHENRQNVGNITVHEWDARGDRHRSEDRGDGKADSLIGRNGERFGGDLESIRRDGASTVYVFKSDFQKEPLELSEEEVSTLFLGGQSKPSKSGTDGGMILGLRGQGSMRVSKCVFEADTAKVEHPLLGALECRRVGISSLERIWKTKKQPVND